jgi:hypothetical protein
MDDFLILGIALLGMAILTIAGVIGYETVWKPHRRKQIERDHFRSKRGS